MKLGATKKEMAPTEAKSLKEGKWLLLKLAGWHGKKQSQNAPDAPTARRPNRFEPVHARNMTARQDSFDFFLRQLTLTTPPIRPPSR